MSRIVQLSLMVALAPLAARPIEAQRVRLWAPKPTVGTLIRSDSASFVLVTGGGGDTVTLSRRAVERADISRGTHGHTLQGAALGGVLGGALGGVFGAASYRRPACDPDVDPFCWDFGRGVSLLVGALAGGLAGGVLGAVIGSQTRTERWTPAPRLENPRLTVAPRSIGVQLSIRW